MTDLATCPVCSQSIRAAAVLCKHCKADLRAPHATSGDLAEDPSQTSPCPSCGQMVRRAALLCKYCHADLATRAPIGEDRHAGPAHFGTGVLQNDGDPEAHLDGSVTWGRNAEAAGSSAVEEGRPSSNVLFDLANSAGGDVARSSRRAFAIAAAVVALAGATIVGWLVLRRLGPSPTPDAPVAKAPPSAAAPRDPGIANPAPKELSEVDARDRLKAFLVEGGKMPPSADLSEFERQGDAWEGTYAEEGRFIAIARIDAKTGECLLMDASGDLPAAGGSAAASGANAAASLTEEDRGPQLPELIRTALEAALEKEPHGSAASFPVAYGDGATRLHVQWSLPQSRPRGPDPAVRADSTSALLLVDRNGGDVARRIWNVDLQNSGKVVMDSLPVPPGHYDLAMVLLGPDGAQLRSSRSPVEVAPLPLEFATSPLLVAGLERPAEPGREQGPLVFSSRQFFATAGGNYAATAGLYYVLRVYNPTVERGTGRIDLRRKITITTSSGRVIDVPLSAEGSGPAVGVDAPEGAFVVDVAGSIVDEGQGQKLADYFLPGSYTLTVVVTDRLAGRLVKTSAPFVVHASEKSDPREE